MLPLERTQRWKLRGWVIGVIVFLASGYMYSLDQNYLLHVNNHYLVFGKEHLFLLSIM